MLFNAVLFDWDGTLYNSGPATYEIYRDIFKEKNLGVLELEEFRREYSANYHSYYEKHNVSKELWKELDEEWVERFIARETEMDLFGCAKEVLLKLKAKGIRVGIVSNGQRKRLEHQLNKYGIMKFFDVVVGVDDEGAEFKPAPGSLITAMKKLGLNGENCSSALHIGDMVEDVEAGKRAGMQTAAVLSGVHGVQKLKSLEPDYLMEDVCGLLELIE
ncbi:MAG: HAD family hydrolase [Candidatus Micrarchaeota archaeon]